MKSLQEELAARYNLSRPSAAFLPLSPGPVVKADERSGASQEALITGASAVGCARTGGEERTKMEEKIIKTKRGLYGQVNITLPMPFKTSLMDLQKKSGMKKAEFLRTVLLMGKAQITEKVLGNDLLPEVQAKGASPCLTSGAELSQQPART